MDLKTYAVHRKLEYGDDLLPYVVDGIPVPVPVVESCFQTFFENMEDERAEQLLEDYPKLLAKDIPVVVLRDEETGGYEVSGDIPDRMVEAIECVYKVDPQEIARAFTAYRLNVIHGQDCEILNTSCSDQAKRVVEDLKERLQDVLTEQGNETTDTTSTLEPEALEACEELKVIEGGESEVPDEFVAGLGEEDTVLETDATPIEDVSDLDEPEENVSDLDESTEDVSDLDESEEDESDEDQSDVDAPDLDESDMSNLDEPEGDVSELDADDALKSEVEPAEATGFETENDLDEAFDEGEAYDFANEPDQGADFSAALRRLYDRFCEDLRHYGLDKRLNLAM